VEQLEEKLQWQKPKKLRARPSLPSASRPISAPKRRSEGEAEGRERKRQKKLWVDVYTVYIYYIYIMVSKCDLLGFNGNYDGI
jgi:hypothetical protein